MHTKDGTCSPRLPKDHPPLSQLVSQESHIHNPLSGGFTQVQGVKYSQAELQEAKALNVHIQDLPWSTREIMPCKNSTSQVNHDLIGFYKKKNILIQKMDILTEEQWDRLNSLEARLKILECCAIKCTKRVSNQDAIPSSMNNQFKTIEHYNKGECNPSNIPSVPSTDAENQVKVDNTNLVEHGISKVKVSFNFFFLKQLVYAIVTNV